MGDERAAILKMVAAAFVASAEFFFPMCLCEAHPATLIHRYLKIII
jgi:hypothetical protein